MSDKNALTVEVIDKKYPIAEYNRVFPSTTHFESVIPYHKASIEVLHISPNVNDKEVFKLASTKIGNEWIPVLSLTKIALDKIGNLLGVEWLPEKCRRTDDRTDPNITEFSVVGRIKKFDGSYLTLTGTKQIDLQVYEAEHRFQCEEKVLSEKGWNFSGNKYKTLEAPGCSSAIDRSVRKRMIEVGKHKLALAESGAKTRAIRSFGVKSTYTPDELKKPFAVPHLHIDHEAIAKDPSAKRAVLNSAIGAESQLFPDDGGTSESAEIIQDDVEEKPPEDKNQEPDAATLRTYQEAEFKSFDFETRFESVEKLLEKHNVQVDGKPLVITKEAFKKRTNEKQVGALMWIYDEIHKDDKPAVEDNIPV